MLTPKHQKHLALLGPQLSRKEEKPYEDSCQQSFWLQWEGLKSTITLSADRAGTDVSHADSSCSRADARCGQWFILVPS